MHKIIKVAAVVIALFPAAIIAQDFEAGWAAYDRGDYEAALKEFSPLAEQGNADAQSNLGVMYGNGEGVPQDYAEAVRWYRLAAEQGDAKAQNNLGVMYGNGEGVPQDYVRAHMWANIAAANGAENGAELRDHLAAKMTPSDISKAQTMARECLESSYKNCPE